MYVWSCSLDPHDIYKLCNYVYINYMGHVLLVLSACTCAARAALQQSGTQLNSCTVARDAGVRCQEERVAKLIGQENSFGSIILKCQPQEFVLYI